MAGFATGSAATSSAGYAARRPPVIRECGAVGGIRVNNRGRIARQPDSEQRAFDSLCPLFDFGLFNC